MTTTTAVAQDELMTELLKPESRPAPQGLFTQMLREPVSRMRDGSWVVSSYAAVREVIGSPSLASDSRRAADAGEDRRGTGARRDSNPPFMGLDPPDHERVRGLFMRHFGPPTAPDRVIKLEPEIARLTRESFDRVAGGTQLDVVQDVAFPLPVAVICSLLGIPVEEQEQFHHWSTVIAQGAAPDPTASEETIAEQSRAVSDCYAYMLDVVRRRKVDPSDDLLSGMVHDNSAPSRISDEDIANNAVTLLIAGHETSVNGTGNTIYALLRNPEVLAEVRADPSLVPQVFEESLRLEPPVQFRDRLALADITLGGVTIPQGSTVWLALAAANRDPARFEDPMRFDIHRADNQHLSFFGGPHYCFGAPLARREVGQMVSEFVRRVENPRLVQDPPPFAANPALRGPERLVVEFDRIVD